MKELHLTIGISGSGKSTVAEQIAREKNLLYLSSDYLRSKFGTGQDDQGVSHIVFKNMAVWTDVALEQGFNVMLDATFTYPKSRKEYIEIGRKHGARVIAHFVNTPMHIAMARNAMRSRQVPYDVIQRQATQLVPPQPGEFDEVQEY